MSIIKRAKNAAVFYKEEFIREHKKERDIIRGLKSGKPMVSYMGFTGHNNLGDEILYDAYKALFPELVLVPFRDSKRMEQLAAKHQKPLYVAGFLGGGTLINQSTRWLDQIAVLQAQGLPIYCLGTGVTVNDFREKHEKTSMGEWVKTLETFKQVGVRGPYSKQMLEAAGFKNFVVTGDTALTLAPAKMPKRPGNKVIGFNYGLVKQNQIWGDADTYTQNIAKAIKNFIKDGYEIRLLTVWDKDIPSTEALLQLVDDPKCTLRLCYKTLEDFNAELAECQYFIGQKLHASIMACMERIPTIMIEYQPKCRDFMASVDMEDYVIKTSDCSPEGLQKLFNKLEKNASVIQKTLDKRVTGYRKIQKQEAAKITKQLLK